MIPNLPRGVGPGAPHYDGPETVTGMRLRDWLAGQAMVGLCANPDLSKASSKFAPKDVRTDFARTAYEIADAMLAAREPKP